MLGIHKPIIFGIKVKFYAYLERKSKWEQEKHCWYKFWQRKQFGKTSGIITGKRTLHNGYNHYDPDCGNSFQSNECIIAYVVATDLKLKPKLVLLEDLEIIE